MSNFFGASSSGSGSNANKSSSSSGAGSGVAGWGTFLKQGLSTIESKLEMVLDIEVPIPGGATVLPSSTTGATAGKDMPRKQPSLRVSRTSQDAVNDSVEFTTDSSKGDGKASASAPKDVKDSGGDQDVRKSASVTDARRSMDSSKSSGKEEVSVTSTPPISGGGSAAAVSNESAAAAVAAANRERLEQRMRGIFKKPAESPPSTPPLSAVVARSLTVSPSLSARQSTSIETMDKASAKSSMEREAISIDGETSQVDILKDLSTCATADRHGGLEDKAPEESPAVVENDPGLDPDVNETKDTESDAKQEIMSQDQEEETVSKPEQGLRASSDQEDKSNAQSSSKLAIDNLAGVADIPVIEVEAVKESDQQILPAEPEGTSESLEAKADYMGLRLTQDDIFNSKAADVVSDRTSFDAGQAVSTSVAPALDQPSTPDDHTEVAPPIARSEDVAVPSTTNDNTKVGTTKASTNMESAVPCENPLKRVLEQREEQLFKVMQEQSSLLERLRELEDGKAAEDALHITKVAGLEKILETQKKELEIARGSNLASQPKSIQKTLEEQRALLEEKDEQIRGLLAEGEVLSKKEFKNLTAIKTLRMKNIEAEKLQMDSQKKLDKVVSDHADAQAKVTKLTEENKQHSESVKSLHDINQRQNKQMTKMEVDLVHFKEEKASLQLGLDRAWQELEEARKTSAELSSQAHAAALEREVKLNENLNSEMEALKTHHAAIESSLRQDIQELRVSLSNREELAGEKEDQLMMEIRTLQAQLERNDNDSYELQETLDEARRPLLRQIEALQNQQSIANRNWERIEKSLTRRITETEEDAAKAQERERAARDKLDELKSHVTALESRIEALRVTDTQLRSEVNASKRISKEKDEEARQAQSELTRERLTRERVIEEAKEDTERKLRLQQQAEMDKLKQQIQQLQQQRQGISEDNPVSTATPGVIRRPSSASSPMLSGGSSVVSGLKSAIGGSAIGSNFDSITSPTSQDGFPPTMSRSSSSHTMSGTGHVSPSVGLLSLGSNATGQAVAIERLNTVVRQLEGQVTFLNEQVRSANKNKDELSDELVRVTMELEEMQEQASRGSGMEQELGLLQQRHKAALEMLGEKTEEVQELRADLLDVKEAYRDQISDLLGQLESLRRPNAR